MNATNSSGNQDSPETIERAIEDCQVALDLNQARIERLTRTAFEDPERAMGKLKSVSRTHGVDHAIKLLNDGGVMGRAWTFGFTNAALFAGGGRRRGEVKEALNELPEALRERRELAKRLTDLGQSRRAALERADQRRIHGLAEAKEQERTRDNAQSHDQTPPTGRKPRG